MSLAEVRALWFLCHFRVRALEFRGAEFRPPEFGTMVSTGERSGGAEGRQIALILRK